VSTTRELIDAAAGELGELGVETPRLDAELLLAMAIGVDRTAVVAHHDAPVGADAERTFRAAVARRVAGEPIAYIRGLREFHGIALSVDARALIPRPESEALVDLAIAEVMRRLGGGAGTSAAGPAAGPTGGRADGSAADIGPLRVADVGTGSGALAIAIAAGLRSRRVPADAVSILATDISPAALELARENAVGHGLGEWLRFAEADLLPGDETRFALIVANLPYIASGDLSTLPASVRHEPMLALDGGPDGLRLIDRLLGRLPAALAPGGLAALEIGADQGVTAAERIAERLPGWPARIQADLAGLPRVAVVERPA
jgi:release factor glutamine methyltransferase